MAKPTNIPDKEELIEKIIELRTPGYQAAKIPPEDDWHVVERALSGSNSEDIRQQQLADAKKIADSLKRKPLAIIKQIYEEEFKQAAEETRQKEIRDRENERREFDEKEKMKIWNRPASKARFDYWGKMPYWSISEGIILFLGYDPRAVTHEDLTRFYGLFKYSAQTRYEEIYELAMRSLKYGQLSNDNTPNDFIQWARQHNLSIPSELETLINYQSSDTESSVVAHEFPLNAPADIDTPRKQTREERDQELKEAADQLAKKYHEQGKHWNKETLAMALSRQPEYAHLTYANIYRIIPKPKVS